LYFIICIAIIGSECNRVAETALLLAVLSVDKLGICAKILSPAIYLFRCLTSWKRSEEDKNKIKAKI